MAFTVPLISAVKKIVHKSVFLATAQQRKRQAPAGKPASTAPAPGENEYLLAAAHGAAHAVHGLHHGCHGFRRRELGNAMAQVEHVARACRWRAKRVEHFRHFGADLIRAGKQDGRVEIALQAHFMPDQLARARQVDGPVPVSYTHLTLPTTPYV